MQIYTDGLIIREQAIGESDRLVTVLTRDEGLLRAFVRRAKDLKNRGSSATQLLCYSRLTIYRGREKYIIGDARPIKVFFELRSDIERLSLAQYFCELAGKFAPEGTPSEPFLRLLLNALHFLCEGSRPPLLLKATVEMRLLALAGYMPDLVACSECACYEAETMYFLPQKGILVCDACKSPQEMPAVALTRGVLQALRHIIYAEFDKLFSFTLSPEGTAALANAAEAYLLSCLGHSLPTLDFYKRLTV
ncbi:DNA repair protein RecO [Yeguia hominis]|uniref:DNA repair protein RecO n=1 Tax=Yeguia hominis TaxID=2763662 RepID=A0A926D759_9FIRM|nr:DNA repair protein RecO [Yeguia hominis]MBC8532943.1 DNA repair protein RecO [Yeguia hominis]